MNGMSHVRRFAVLACLVVALLAAFTPGTPGLPLGVLAPLWFFIAIVLSFLLPIVDEQNRAQQVLALPSFSPRPPPAL
jgi:uncharacterized RDD family membrane protein YckC